MPSANALFVTAAHQQSWLLRGKWLSLPVCDCSDGLMDQVEKALLVISGDPLSGQLAADPHVGPLC